MADKRRTEQAKNALGETIPRMLALLRTDPLDWTGLPDDLFDDIRAILRFLGISYEHHLKRVEINAPNGREIIDGLFEDAARRGARLEMRGASERFVDVFEIGAAPPPPPDPEYGSEEWMERARAEIQARPEEREKTRALFQAHGLLVESDGANVG